MDELKKTMCEAYELLKQIPVKGADVDTMFFVRQKMQEAYHLIDEMKEVDSNE